MDDRSEFKVKRVLWASMFLVLAFITVYNINDPWMPVFLSGVLIFLITISNIITFPTRKNTRANKIIIYIEIILVLLINYYDNSDSSQAFYLVLIAVLALIARIYLVQALLRFVSWRI